ncbi:glycosyltransferase [Luteimonas sp. 8-5]|uniref:glycosyltransferase family 2 protein n=1 Tax=Luteimonas sp. 8-5 TaxID=3039387 RepID=UPI002436EB8D|nr:glycosyltransferase [Luteimonas sp. 8-5]MDG6347841.1 glycosyltransferase [Luteimonas sp. 8-5]
MALVYHPGLNTPARPRVSVCIANYNGEKLLQACLDSVWAQDCDFDFEVLVHDDASSDSSVDLIRRCYPQVELLVSYENVGYCVSNNRMVERARGDFVLLLNNDAALEKDAIRSLISAAEYGGAPAILTLPQYDWETGDLVDRGCLVDPFFNPIPNREARAEVAYVIGACLWCPRETWQSLGGFPEWMGSVAEDLYLCGLARLRGVEVKALSMSGYRHRQGSSFGGNRVGADGLRTTVRRRRLSERNKTLSLAVLTPGIWVIPILIAHLLALSVEGALMSLARRDTRLWRDVYFPAITAPFHEARALRERRKLVQGTRSITTRRWFNTVRFQLRKVVLLSRYGVPRVD